LVLQSAEAGIVAHMNDDHADVVQAYATWFLGKSGRGGASPAATLRASICGSVEK
jgi:hypothetical protein